MMNKEDLFKFIQLMYYNLYVFEGNFSQDQPQSPFVSLHINEDSPYYKEIKWIMQFIRRFDSKECKELLGIKQENIPENTIVNQFGNGETKKNNEKFS